MRKLRHRRTFSTAGMFQSAYQWITRSRWIRNHGVSRPYEEARALGLIDPRIRNLVAKLNVEGTVATFTCCEGHWPEDVAMDGGTFNSPYVGFDASIEFAARLNRALVYASPLESGALHNHWVVEYGGLGFVLRAHMGDSVRRDLLDADFSVIGRLVDDVLKNAHVLQRDNVIDAR